MSYRHTLHIAAASLMMVAVAISPVAVWAAYEGVLGDPGQVAAAQALGLASLIGFAIFGSIVAFTRTKSPQLGTREALLMVGLTWTIAPVVAGAPFFLWTALLDGAQGVSHPFDSAVNCYFEAMSGLTTTGASVLSDIESLPRGLVLWRSVTHWLGGLGIVLLFVAVLPVVGTIGRKLHMIEATGPAPDASRPRIRDLARVLWSVYAVITLGSILALRLAGLTWFESICESFGAIATGGFSVRNASIAEYNSWAVDTIILVVMVLGAVNFSLYVDLVSHRAKSLWRDSELRLLLASLLIGSGIVAASIAGVQVSATRGEISLAGWADAIRFGVFNLASMHTDTGFATADFDRWAFPAVAAIVIGTFIGGSSGSTTGGIKVVRLLAAAKIMLHEVQHFVRPAVVEPVRVGHRILDAHGQIAVMTTVLCFILALGLGTILLVVIGADGGTVDFRTGFSASLATLCTAGPGLGGVGPTQNYDWLPDASKLILCGLMLIGRLEVIPILVLLDPRFWRMP